MYPLSDSSLRTSSKLSMPLYFIPVTIPSGFDSVTCSMPLSITTCKNYMSHQYPNCCIKERINMVYMACYWNKLNPNVTA